ncbi:MAG: D-glycero-beta-D-manno-heptose 1-phosphate adenylyltransferase [Pyrinomonadaceae bacterium]|nr:D-glycero-beta-D-manno-heptose 1-phosphate adenylyltransferase [Pyrinomonadaceae bacterium]
MLVFTNGCFDLIHPGHVDLLERARSLGDRLVVGINSDRSVRAIKGPDRPLQDQEARKAVLLGLRSVDEVVIFDELTPESLIGKLRPDVLVKGGDWTVDEIIGAELVTSYGGKVLSLPLKGQYSTSRIVNSSDNKPPTSKKASGIDVSLGEHLGVMQKVLAEQSSLISECVEVILKVFERGGKLLVCGNGGSAADAQHIAAELSGRYERDRQALPAIALTTDTSALTAISNDFGFERVFARQVEAIASRGDCLLAISTSGNSPNIIAAVMEARRIGCSVIGLTGASGKKLAGLCDAVVMVPSERTARVQEAHITIAHIWCEIIDARASEFAGRP